MEATAMVPCPGMTNSSKIMDIIVLNIRVTPGFIFLTMSRSEDELKLFVLLPFNCFNRTVFPVLQFHNFHTS